MFKAVILICFIFFTYNILAQEKECSLSASVNDNISIVDTNDIICLANSTKKRNTIIYTFGIWCGPCRLHLKNAIKLKNEYDVELYILLVDDNEKNILDRTYNYLKNIDEEIKILILSPEYSKRQNRRYKLFLKEITPDNFENINDMSKYIVLDKNGNVQMVTNWKDNRDFDWQDDINMLNKKVIPLLKKN